jgi:hypothetical protein
MWGIGGIIAALIDIAEHVPEDIAAAEKVASGVVAASTPVITGLKDFLASDTGQQIESWLSSLFNAVSTPDAAVVVVPKVMGEASGIEPAPTEQKTAL